METFFSGLVSVIINGRELVKESKLVINSNTKIAFIGINGIGKTSVINRLIEIFKETGFNNYLGLEQDIIIEDNQTCLDYISQSNIDAYNANKRLNELSQIEELTDSELEEYNNISDLLLSHNWDQFLSEARKILKGLGFKDSNKETKKLSGGWIMRLALAKILLLKPKLLLLDEPTNHLDLEASIWLTNYLIGYPNSILLVTHDADLACEIADITWYIGDPKLEGNSVYTIRGNYYDAKNFVIDCRNETLKNYEKYENKLANFKRSKPPKTKNQIEEYIRNNEVPRPPQEYTVNIEWNEVGNFRGNILSIRDVSFTYPSGAKIFDKINFDIFNDSRIALVGSNGAGKTTLFQLCSGELNPDPDSDVIIRNNQLRVGYYYQRLLDNLPLEMTPTEYLQSLNSKLSIGDCKGILGRLSLKKTHVGDPTSVKIKNLSGGQKVRVAFAGIQGFNPHLLLLDEPTNHLDIESIEALIDGLNNFNGAIVIITHNIKLIKSLNNIRIFVVGNQKVEEWRLPFEEYCKKVLLDSEL